MYGLGLGALLFAIGVITYFLAPRVGPNPIFGVRVGYSFANRQVWDKTNRFGGALFALIGLAIAALAALLAVLNIPVGNSMAWITGVTIASLLAATGWMFVYARRLAQASEAARDVAPVKFRWAYVAPVLITFGVLMVSMAVAYPQLPSDRLATHFDLSNRPDGWSTRDGFVLGYAGLAALYVLIDMAVVMLATREPLIAFGRWGSKWRLDPERGLVYSGTAFSLVNLILIGVFADIYWFNTRGLHLFPLSALLWMIVVLVAVLIGLFFLLGRRESAPA
jgi:uncharacterized membrane protein